ncbi:hypothetical protein E2986_08123, partial [Frieseomelitta varia]
FYYDLFQHCFVISYRRENQRQYELKAATETDCKMWIDAIREASFNKLRLQKEELEQKHLHLLQIVESEKTAKWQYTQQCEELMSEIKKLRAEETLILEFLCIPRFISFFQLCALKKELRPVASSYTGKPRVQRTMSHGTGSLYMSGSLYGSDEHDSVVTSFGIRNITEAEVQKIKKVQSFLRGWLCRRRWKQIVEQYIKSPHAESMRKRNRLENKIACGGRSLETFLTYPMHQVSETENLRKNLGVERMIVEGCDILLDVNQVFVRQGKRYY